MPFTHGKDTVFWLDNAAGTLTDISAYVTSVDGLPGDNDTGETTTMGKESKTYISGLHDATVTLALIWDSAVDDLIGTIAQQKTARSFEYGPEGGATGNNKQSGEALITSFSSSAPVGDVVTGSITLQVSGDVTKGTFA